MYRIIIASALVVLLGVKDIPHQLEQEPTRIIELPAIRPTTLAQWIDTCAARYNIPPQVIWHVGTNESGMGRSSLAKRSNNLFGIKADDHWKGKPTVGKYRKYSSQFESVQDFCEYVHTYYSHLIGKPLDRWVLRGYAVKPYRF